MALYLVQHGLSLAKEQDPEQGLSSQGMDDVKRIAEVAKFYDVQVARIRHSGKKRARQTAEILSEFLTPQCRPEQMDGLKPLDEVTALAPSLSPEENVMLVGHLPFMEKLIAYLTTGNTENRVFKCQNGGIICLDQESDSQEWFIKWTLMPNIN